MSNEYKSVTDMSRDDIRIRAEYATLKAAHADDEDLEFFKATNRFDKWLAQHDRDVIRNAAKDTTGDIGHLRPTDDMVWLAVHRMLTEDVGCTEQQADRMWNEWLNHRKGNNQ